MAKRIIIYLILTAGVLVMWEKAARGNGNLRLLISSPTQVASYFAENYESVIKALAYTAYESLVGFLIAVVASLALGFFCLMNRRVMEFVLPLMILSQVVPIVTLAPLFIVLLGIGLTSKIAMAALMCFFPIFVGLASGVSSIKRDYHNLFDLYNASRTIRVARLYFPLSVPYIFSGLKVSSTLAVVGAIVAEFNGADIGLGKNLFLAAKRLEAELMMNSIALSCLLGGLFYFAVYVLEKKFGQWYLNGGNN